MEEILYCGLCGSRISRDEAALNRKLSGIQTQEFLCLGCMAEELGVTEQDLQHKIEDFRESGCTLFED